MLGPEGSASGTSSLNEVPSSHHYRALDGVRGLAILLVFAFHSARPDATRSVVLRAIDQIFGQGWIGVDIFFVLSGFLITGILYDTRNEVLYFKRFYVRRALRIFPIFYALCLAVLLLAPFLQIHWRWGYLAFLLYAANILLASTRSYDRIGPFVTTHMWSLAVEEQFYLLWPATIRILKTRVRMLRVTLALMALAVLLRFVQLCLGVSWHSIYRELPTRMDSLAAGATLALLLRGPRKHVWIAVTRYCLVPLWLAILAIGCFLPDFQDFNAPIIIWGPTLLALASVTLIGEAVRSGSMAGQILSNSVLRFLGRISYGLYLYQGCVRGWMRPLRLFFDERLHSYARAGVCALAVMFCATVAFSYLSYRFFEMPFLRLKNKLAP